MLAATACIVWMSLASARTISADAAFGERAAFRLNKATLREEGASPALLEKVGVPVEKFGDSTGRVNLEPLAGV